MSETKILEQRIGQLVIMGRVDEMSKTKRKPYTQSKRFDATCRCHGSCGWCKGNRKYQDTRYRDAADRELQEYSYQRFSGNANDVFWEDE